MICVGRGGQDAIPIVPQVHKLDILLSLSLARSVSCLIVFLFGINIKFVRKILILRSLFSLLGIIIKT